MGSLITLTGQHGRYDTVDASTHQGLVDAVAHIRLTPGGWQSLPAKRLLRYASEQLSSSGLPSVDAITAAWELWAGRTDLSLTDNAWAYTVQVVRRTLGREEQAERKLTSVQGIRRAGADEALFADAEVPEIEAPAAADTSTPVAAPMTSSALISVRQVLIMAGISPAQASHIIDVIVEGAGSSSNFAAATDRLSRDMATPTHLGLTHQQWRALVSMILGTTRGNPGLFVLTSRGHPNPMDVRHVRSARKRFLNASDVEAMAVAS